MPQQQRHKGATNLSATQKKKYWGFLGEIQTKR